jgi:Spy/CpxP family protein refolding chaperone
MRQLIQHNSLWIIAVLVLLNLGLAAVLLFAPKPGPPPPGRIVKMWVKELGLSDQQIPQFEALENTQRQRGEALHKQMNSLKQQMIETVVQYPGDSTRLNGVIAASDSIHHALNDHLIDYYYKLYNACTPEQQERLAEVYLGMLRRRR